MDLLKRLTELDVPAGREHVAHEFLTKEAEKLGYEVCIVPKARSARNLEEKPQKLRLIEVGNIRELAELI